MRQEEEMRMLEEERRKQEEEQHEAAQLQLPAADGKVKGSADYADNSSKGVVGR